MRAKKWLRLKTKLPDEKFRTMFLVRPEEGGFAGSLVGLGYITREDDKSYVLTLKGRKWLGYSHSFG